MNYKQIKKIIETNTWVVDSNIFFFSLKSNEQRDEMRKVDVSEKTIKFGIYDKTQKQHLFRFTSINSAGSYILVNKKGKSGSYYSNNGIYDFFGNTNLNNKTNEIHFTPKRIVVIQMK